MLKKILLVFGITSGIICLLFYFRVLGINSLCGWSSVQGVTGKNWNCNCLGVKKSQSDKLPGVAVQIYCTGHKDDGTDDEKVVAQTEVENM